MYIHDFNNRDRNFFDLILQAASAIRRQLEELKENLRTAGLTLQPIPIFVGPLAAIEAAYVAVNTTLYKVDSALHAIDTCFKIYFALDCKYSERGSSLWLFIQKAGYDIHVDSDITNRSLNALLGEIEREIEINA